MAKMTKAQKVRIRNVINEIVVEEINQVMNGEYYNSSSAEEKVWTIGGITSVWMGIDETFNDGADLEWED